MILDLTPILQPVVYMVGIVAIPIAARLGSRALSIFETRTGVHLAEQQRQVVLGAVQTAAGMVVTQLAGGVLRLEHVNTENPFMKAHAQAVINSVPDAAAALGVDRDAMARMIVGAVGRMIPDDPTVPTVKSLAAPAPAPVPTPPVAQGAG